MASTTDLVNYLKATLDPNPNIRITAELKLSEYLALPGASISGSPPCRLLTIRRSARPIEAGLALSSLTIAQDAEMPLRQMSSRVFIRLTRLDGFFSRQALREHYAPQIRDGTLVSVLSVIQGIRTIC
jgi:hypothetical protein